MKKYLSRINKNTGKREYLVDVYQVRDIEKIEKEMMNYAKNIVKMREELIRNGYIKGDQDDTNKENYPNK